MTNATEERESELLMAELGLAVFTAQALEYTLTSLYAATHLRDRAEAGQRLRDLMDSRYSQTLGLLVRDAAAELQLPEQLTNPLNSALQARNWLIHHFYREFATAALDRQVRRTALTRLRSVRDELGKLSEQLHDEVLRRIEQAGIPRSAAEEGARRATEEYIREQLGGL